MAYNQTPQSLLQEWSELGISFAQEPRESPLVVDPEQTLVESMGHSYDKKLIALIVCWLKNYGHYLNIEKLKKKLHQNCSEEQLAWMGGILLKARGNEIRFDSLIKWIGKQLPKRKDLFLALPQEEKLIELKGIDPDFAKMGIKTIPLVEESEKKLRPVEYVLSKHPILRARALFGVGYRADLFFLVAQTNKLPKTPYSAMKLLGSSYQTAYQLWNDLQTLKIDPRYLRKLIQL